MGYDSKGLKNKNGETLEDFLNNYNSSRYEKPSVTVDTLIFTVSDKYNENKRKVPEKELKILLIKRKDHPYIGQWAIPGGFVNMDEDIDIAAERELKEETNVTSPYLEQLYTFGDVNRDPRMRVISVSYMALIDELEVNAKAGDDACDVKWFIIKERNIIDESKTKLHNGHKITRDISFVLESEDGEVRIEVTLRENDTVNKAVSKKKTRIISSKTENIAFDHIKIINYALERLQNKLEYTPIAFNLLPDMFTLTELQKLYECILGKKLIKFAFRRKVAAMVLETEGVKTDLSHRPAKLYTYNPEWHIGFETEAP